MPFPGYSSGSSDNPVRGRHPSAGWLVDKSKGIPVPVEAAERNPLMTGAFIIRPIHQVGIGVPRTLAYATHIKRCEIVGKRYDRVTWRVAAIVWEIVSQIALIIIILPHGSGVIGIRIIQSVYTIVVA
jgi:hypothetical protein